MGRSRKKDQESGVAMLVAEAILGVLLGAVFACVWLAIRPVSIVDALPKDKEETVARRHEVTYVSGREAPLRQSQWKRKQRAFLKQDPNGVELLEQDVNRWVATEFGALELNKKWETYSLEYHGGLPNFRFDGERAHAGLVNEVSAFEIERKLVVQAEGAFRQHDGRFEFVADRMLVGALAIPGKTLRTLLADWFVGGFAVSDAFAKSWSEVDDVKIEEGRMKLGFRAPAPTVVEESMPSTDAANLATSGETLSDPAPAATTVPEDEADEATTPTASSETPPAPESAPADDVPAAAPESNEAATGTSVEEPSPAPPPSAPAPASPES
ncbi:MAG: hypothetical protein ACREIA_10075 [Opitutaceae bacterium]